MPKTLFAILSLALLASPVTAKTQAALDCPLARVPYSSSTPLIDLQLDARSKGVLDAIAPDLVSHVTRNFGGGDLPPGFSAIITPVWMLRGRDDSKDLAAKLDVALAAIPLDDSAVRARCARYDVTPPVLATTIKHPALLIFDKINGFRDSPSVDAATAALQAMAERKGWTLVFSDNGAVFNARQLGRFDAVVWNNVSGDALTLAQRRAFKAWMMAGGGFVGFHGAGGDPVYFWDWYVDTLIGARFIGHPMNPHFQSARVVVENRAHPITQGLPAQWSMTEEWYSFAQSPRASGATILLSLAESSYHPGEMGGLSLSMGDHPIAWTRCVGKGRAFYTAIGHRPESYSEPNSVKLLTQGIAWAMMRKESNCR
jgi:uncharacterized protein